MLNDNWARTEIAAALASRGLRPAAELAANKPCGTRVRYMGGCRCVACRRANSDYETQRAAARKRGEGAGIVSAERARAHLQLLSRQGVGYKTVADAAKVSASGVAKILAGSKDRLRATTERAILGVSAAMAADKAFVDGGPTWALLDDLLACGYTRTRLATELLGRPAKALQLKRHSVTVRNAARVRRVWERLRFGTQAEAAVAQRQLQQLRAEGYLPGRILRDLETAATERRMPTPDLEPRAGRMHAGTCSLLAELHTRLMSE